jgi:signal peptidase II
MTITPKLAAGLIGLAVSLPLDLFTKWLVNRHLVFGDRHPVIEGFFYLTHVRNTGAAFGLLSDGPAEIRLVFFVGVSVVAIGIILSFFRKLGPSEWVSALALGFILGGALGNLRDRIQYGEVVDFLHFRLWGGYSWPDFNFADSFIVVGVAILVLELLASEGETSGATDGGGESSA